MLLWSSHEADAGLQATKRNTQSKAKAATAQRSTGKTACKSLPAARNTKQSNPNSLTAARQQPPELASGTDVALPLRYACAADEAELTCASGYSQGIRYALQRCAQQLCVVVGGRPDTNTKALPVSDKAIAHKPNVDVSRDVISQVKPLPAIPASRPNAGGGVQGSCAPSHMSKPIVFNTTGPLFRAAGLRPPTGSKPLHQIQPQA